MKACNSCGAADLRWVTMAASGRRILIEPAECKPTERGALFIVNNQWAYSAKQIGERLAQREGVSEYRARELAASRYPSHLSHFATCPNAEQHRRTG